MIQLDYLKYHIKFMSTCKIIFLFCFLSATFGLCKLNLDFGKVAID